MRFSRNSLLALGTHMLTSARRRPEASPGQEAMQRADPLLASIYQILWTFVTVFILVNMFIAIMTEVPLTVGPIS